MANSAVRRGLLLVLAAVAIVFGFATLASGGFALFGGEAGRAMAGRAVPFVLWFNFLAGFAYVATGAAMLLRRRWALAASLGILVSTLVVFVLFGLHVRAGGPFEPRTVGAMALRSGFWALATAALKWAR